jgi:hypothetical protein
MVSQYGLDYELWIVDYHSNDDLQKHLTEQINFRKEDAFSPNLQRIVCIDLLQNLKFSLKKARNMAVSYCEQDDIIAFSDVDVFVGMDYLSHWAPMVTPGKTFVTTRWKETKAAPSRRIEPEINYGNYLVSAKDFIKVRGMEESFAWWGGDDDDIFHRLKLSGLQEINPYNARESRQFSIIHGDELRLNMLEDATRCDSEEMFEKIYSNTDRIQSNESKFLDNEFSSTISEKRVLYER